MDHDPKQAFPFSLARGASAHWSKDANVRQAAIDFGKLIWMAWLPWQSWEKAMAAAAVADAKLQPRGTGRLECCRQCLPGRHHL